MVVIALAMAVVMAVASAVVVFFVLVVMSGNSHVLQDTSSTFFSLFNQSSSRNLRILFFRF